MGTGSEMVQIKFYHWRLKGFGRLLVQQYQAEAAFSSAKRSDFIAVLSPITCHRQYLYLHFHLYLCFSCPLSLSNNLPTIENKKNTLKERP